MSALVAVSVVSCGLLPDGDTREAHEIPVHALEVPDGLRRTAAHVSYSVPLPSGLSRPAAFVGRSAEPGGPDLPTVWRSDDGRGWTQQAFTAPVAGELVGLVAGEDTGTAVMAGTSWDKGRSRLWVLTSTDTETWDTAAVPQEVSGDAVLAADAADGVPVVLVSDAEQRWSVVRAGSGTTSVRLPDVPDDVQRDDAVLTALGDRVVVLAREGNREEDRPYVSYVSDDGGRTFADPVPFPGGGLVSLSVADARDGVIRAAGSVEEDASSFAVPAIWRSTDGTTWDADSIPVPSSLTGTGSQDWGVTSLVGDVAAIGSGDDALPVVMKRDSSSAGWSELGWLRQELDFGPDVAVMPVGDRVATAVSGRHAGVIGSMSRVGEWTEHASNGRIAELPELSRAVDGPTGPLLSTYTPRVLFADTQVSRRFESGRLAVVENGIGEAVPWAQEAAGHDIVVAGGDPASGSEVTMIAGAFAADSTIAWTGVLRPRDGEPQAFSVPTDGGARITGVVAVPDHGWLAIGETGKDRTGDQPTLPGAWSSPDGVTWAQIDLPAVKGARYGEIEAACARPDGTAVLVGHTSHDDVRSPLALVGAPDGGTWTTLDTSEIGARTSLISCATVGDAVAVVARGADRSAVWQIDAQGGTTQIRTYADADRLDGVAVAGDRLVVVGGTTGPDWTGGFADVGSPGDPTRLTRVRVPVGTASGAQAVGLGTQVQTYWQTPTGVVGWGFDLADVDAGDR